MKYMAVSYLPTVVHCMNQYRLTFAFLGILQWKKALSISVSTDIVPSVPPDFEVYSVLLIFVKIDDFFICREIVVHSTQCAGDMVSRTFKLEETKAVGIRICENKKAEYALDAFPALWT